MRPFEILFGNGTIRAYDPIGPELVDGDPIAQGARAYNNLTALDGVTGGEVRRPFGVKWVRLRLQWPHFRIRPGPLPTPAQLRQLRIPLVRLPRIYFPITFRDMFLSQRERADEAVQVPASLGEGSSFPGLNEVPNTQVQVYHGMIRLHWNVPEIPWWWRIAGPPAHNSVRINGTLTLLYEPVQGGIEGEIEGDMEPPLLPGAHPHVTAEFHSAAPFRFGIDAVPEAVNFAVNGLVLRGNWDY